METLLHDGRGGAADSSSGWSSKLMRDRFVKVIGDATRRRAIGLMSGNQQEPDREAPGGSSAFAGAGDAEYSERRRASRDVALAGGSTP